MRTGTWTIRPETWGWDFMEPSPALAQRQPRQEPEHPNQQRDQPQSFWRRRGGRHQQSNCQLRHDGTKELGQRARHVLRLVDGSLGNVPRRTDSGATLDSPEDSR